MNPDAIYKLDRSHAFANGVVCSVFISGSRDKLEAHRIDWHGHRPPGDDAKFWDEFSAFYQSVLSEVQRHISPEAMHSDEGLAILFPDRVYSLKRVALEPKMG